MATALAELAARVGGMANQLDGGERSDVALALFEVERSLGAAQRRLEKVVSGLG